MLLLRDVCSVIIVMVSIEDDKIIHFKELVGALKKEGIGKKLMLDFLDKTVFLVRHVLYCGI